MLGKQDTHTHVQELIASFNIQIDNLWYGLVLSLICSQFLPQDKVASFAQLSPAQVLHETQRAVGGERLIKLWETLCELRGQEREFESVHPPDAFLTRRTSKMTQKH
jgi:structural maintenance of chromosomes protein 5